ncbi:MAG: sigma-70 family RNA polymerase sigma factor [Ilumatobacteraceae bacterium]|nr:sigma-70 family RNA polymerase sigma factor [Ilumatobacteraceae bacterium]
MRRQGVHAVSAPPTAADQRAAELEVFVQQHSQRLLGALTLITGNRATAEDAMQEALVKAWHRKDQPIDQLTAWITVVATNQARSGWRRKQAEQRALDKGGGRATHDTAAAGEPDDALLEALRALPERERRVAVMHYVLDQSVAQVAAALGVAEGTVKTQLFRARQHLATRLHVDEHDHQQGGAA